MGSLRYNSFLSDSALLEDVMPIYEYRCGPCGFEKEYLQKVNDAPIAACPAVAAMLMPSSFRPRVFS